MEACETEEATAADVNVRAVKRLAQTCAEPGAKLVHFRTNYVFDGRARALRARGTFRPASVYAITKLAGEHAALAYCPQRSRRAQRRSLWRGRVGVERRKLRRADDWAGASGGAIKMVADQRLTPTFTPDLAVGTIRPWRAT